MWTLCFATYFVTPCADGKLTPTQVQALFLGTDKKLTCACERTLPGSEWGFMPTMLYSISISHHLHLLSSLVAACAPSGYHGNDFYGSGNHLSKADAERVLNAMLGQGLLAERRVGPCSFVASDGADLLGFG